MKEKKIRNDDEKDSSEISQKESDGIVGKISDPVPTEEEQTTTLEKEEQKHVDQDMSSLPGAGQDREPEELFSMYL